MAEDEPEQPELEAQMEAATKAIRARSCGCCRRARCTRSF